MIALASLATAALAQQRTVTVYYADGFANHQTMVGNYEITRASFSEDGELLSTSNVTDMAAFMMGYVRVNPARTQVIFSAQAQDKTTRRISPHVLLYEMPLPAAGPNIGVSLVKPTLLLPDITNLTSGCVKPYSPCTQADQFHPTFDYHRRSTQYETTETEAIAFGYRAWTDEGFPGGNQALALRTRSVRKTKDGKVFSDIEVKPLTFNASDIHTMDSCPRFAPGSNGKQIIFQRNLLEGSKPTIAHLDVTTGKVTSLQGALSFVPADFAGCPAFVMPPPSPLSKKATFVFIGKNTSDSSVSTFAKHWGSSRNTGASVEGLDKVYMVAVTIDLSDKPIVVDEKVLFAMPRVNTSAAVDMLALQYCSQVMQDKPAPTVNALVCKTADMKLAELNPETGVQRVNLTMPYPRLPDGTPVMWSQTSYSFQVWAD